MSILISIPGCFQLHNRCCHPNPICSQLSACVLCLQLTTNLIKKAEQGVNSLIAKLGAPADYGGQRSPHASVQQLLHATRSLGELGDLNAGSALGNLQVCCCGVQEQLLMLTCWPLEYKTKWQAVTSLAHTHSQAPLPMRLQWVWLQIAVTALSDCGATACLHHKQQAALSCNHVAILMVSFG